MLRRWRKRTYRQQQRKDSVSPPNRNRGQACEVRDRALLLKISKQLNKRNLDELLFLASGVLPLSAVSQINSCTQLFQCLYREGHLHVGDHSLVKHWLVEIGRSDLASELPGRCTEAEQLSLVDESRDQLHRYRLLRVSESLRRDELKRLVYLCPILPQCLHDAIEEGFQLFQELEQRGRLGPDRYGYLTECLRAVGRMDLANRLIQCEQMREGIPDSPRSFGVPEQTLLFFCRQKRQSYELGLRDLTAATGQQAWSDRTRELWPRILATGNRSVPLETQAAIGALPLDVVDSVIRSTLEGIFSFVESEAQAIGAVMKGDEYQLKKWCTACKSLYGNFDRALQPFGWNRLTREQVSTVCQDRKASHGTTAEKVGTSIQSFCEEFIGGGSTQPTYAKAIDNIRQIESTYYHVWQRLSLLEWATDVVNLGSSSAIDLSRHKALLERLITQHQHTIKDAMPALSRVLDREIVDLAHLLLSKPPLAGSVDATPLQSKVGNHYVAAGTQKWCLLLLELLGVANGYHVNHRETMGAFVQNLYTNNEQCAKMVQAGMEFAVSVTRSMHSQVAVCRRTAEKAASLGPRGCSDVVSELFR